MATARRALTAHEQNAALQKWKELVLKVHAPSSASVLTHLVSNLSSVPAALTGPTSDIKAPTPTPDINDILQVASEIEKENPQVSLILCEYAYRLAQKLDPNSKGRGVLQFKAGLMSHIKQKSDEAAYRRNKSEILRSFYDKYNDLHRRELHVDPPADSEGVIRRQKILMTLRVLLEAINDDNSTEEVKKEMKSIAMYLGASRQDNILPLEGPILPLEGPGHSRLLNLPEVKAAREVLKVEINYDKRERREGEDIFDALEDAFGFQRDNLKNQREHLVLLLANTQSQLWDKDMPTVVNKDLQKTIKKVCDKILENYKNWCSYVRRDCYYNGEMKDHTKVALVALYLCIWGEAANVRFLPECICYIYHSMAGELLYMLENNKIHSSKSCERESGGQSFLEEIIIPIYVALKEEADENNVGKAAHSKWRNYDDFNEFFWSNECFNQLDGWPLKKHGPLFFHQKTGGGQKTSFVEHRTFLHLYHSFVRVWILLVMMLQGLVIIAFTESFSLRTLKILLSLGPTYFVMKFIESVLDIALMVGAYFNTRGDAIFRIFFQFLVYGGCVGGLFYLYWRMYWEEAPSDLFLRIYLWVLGSYVALKLLISLFQHIPAVRQQVEKLDKYIVAESLKWLFKEHFYVGRGLFERPRDHIRYVLFWVIVLACKFAFSYFFQIKPIADATKTIFFFDGEILYAWHDFVSQNNHNALTIFFLWAPVVLVYLLDLQIWYTVFSAILGGVIGAKDRLGEIRSLDMLRSRFEYFPENFIKKLQQERLPEERNKEFKKQNSQNQVDHAYIYAPFWNDIILCLREEDYITDHERDLLTMPTEKTRMLTEKTNSTFVQWPLFLLASKVFLAMKWVVDKKENPKEIVERLEKDKYISSAIAEAFDSVYNLLIHMVVLEPGRVFFQNVYDDVQKSIRDNPVNFLYEFSIADRIENIHKKVTDLTQLLTEDKQPQDKLLQDRIDKAVQNIFEAVLLILPQDLKRERYKDYLNDAARVFFKNTNPLPDKMKGLIPRMHLLLTTKESGSSVPKNGEAQRRLQFFTNSLFMTMPPAPSVRAMKSFSVLTPYYNEIVMFSLEDLQKNNEDGISILFYLQKIFPDEWKNFLQRKNIVERALTQHLQKPGSEFKEDLDLRLWASYRGQTLARTVRGMMYYRKALILQASFENSVTKENKHAMAESLADFKFTYVVSCQIYDQHKASPKKEDNAKANDILHLLRVNEGLRIAFIDSVDGENGKKNYYSKLLKSGGGRIEQVIYTIKLPGDPRLGEGKPENQNHAIIFTRGEALQTIDMDQDNYFEEALKMRNLLEEFEADHGINRATILGVREHVFTGSVSSLAWFMSNQETSFVTLGQRVLARPLKVRMYYGHPDVFDRLFHLTRGGISKASRTINVSKDIFAGFNSTLRRGNVTHHEYIQVGKGRDVGLNQIAMFEAKVSGGNAEQLLSRDVYRLGQLFDFFRMLSFYVTAVGYYVCTMMTTLVVYVFLYGKVYMALSGVGQSFKSSISQNQALQAALDTQFLFQIGMFSAIPMLMVFLLEQGILKAIVNFITMQLQLCSVFYTFCSGTRTHYFGQTVLHGVARYEGTERGFVVQHIKFANNYQLYSRSHFVKALEIVMLLLVIQAYGYDSSTLNYFLLSIFSWFLAVSWLFAPFIFNPSCFEWQKTVEDFDEWTNWLFYRSGVGVQANDSWEAWWNQGQEHIRSPVGRVLETLLSLRFFIFQFGVVYHLKAAHHSLSLNVYGVSWLVFAGIILIFLIFSFSPKSSVNYQMVLRLVQGTVFMIIAAGLVAVLALRIVTFGDICASLLALVPTGWGILCIGIAWKPLIKSMGLWKYLRAIAWSYDAGMGMVIFLPIAILSWFPFVSTFQTRLLFNQAFSRGLEISLILAGSRPTVQPN